MGNCKNWRVDSGRTSWAQGEFPELPFALQWKTKVSEKFSPAPPLTNVNRKLLFTDVAWGDDYATLYCLDSVTGKTLWTFRNSVAGRMALAGVSEDTAVAYQDTPETGILGFNLADGSRAWRIIAFGSGSRFGGIVDGSELILAATDESHSTHILIIDIKTGGVLHRFKCPFPFLEELCADKKRIYGVMVTENKDAREIVALSRGTGELIWRTDVLDLDNTHFGPPQNTGARGLDGLLLSGNRVFVTQFSGKLWSLDADTGSPVWNYGSYQGYLYIPAAANDKLYFRKWERFICLDANTGKEEYAIQHNGTPTSFGAAAGTVAGEYFLFSDNSALFALDLKDGSERWRQNYGKKKVKVWGPCIVADGRLYVTGGDSYAYCFGPK